MLLEIILATAFLNEEKELKNLVIFIKNHLPNLQNKPFILYIIVLFIIEYIHTLVFLL